jgi:hypothetical protein
MGPAAPVGVPGIFNSKINRCVQTFDDPLRSIL